MLRITATGAAELLEPAIEGLSIGAPAAKYSAGGVLARDGCIYFAPDNAGKVLRITTGGAVELLEPEIEGLLKYSAGGVLAQDGCVHFAPYDAGRILSIVC